MEEPEHTVTFIGNATTVLRLGNFTLLTDPNFLHAGQRAYFGYGFWSRRRTDPALEFDALPRLDGVLLSHLHGDHFDRIARTRLPPTTPIFTTPHAARQLDRQGFLALTPLSTWESYEWRREGQVLRITALPAQHGPDLLHRLMPPTMGSLVDLERGEERLLRLYITGDTLYRDWLGEVVRKYPDIDAALIHLGGTRILGILLTMDGQQGAKLVAEIPSGIVLPIHYDDYTAFRSPLRHFLSATRRKGLANRVRMLPRGEPVPLPSLVHHL